MNADGADIVAYRQTIFKFIPLPCQLIFQLSMQEA